MKKLMFLLVLVSNLVFAQGEMGRSEANQIVSQIKDVEIRKMLETTAEFRECRDEYPFDAADTPDKRNDKIKAAQACFKRKLERETDTDKLKKMADALGLQQYGLVKGKTANDIQTYLNKKMYQSMTGVDPDEADKKKLQESLKYKNKKHIDQRVFITLYKNQVTKNSLYEVSRYCFYKFRKNTPAPTTQVSFGDYWKSTNFSPNANPSKSAGDYKDDGQPAFGALTENSDKSKIYEEIFQSIGVKEFTQWNEFFKHCGQMMKVLCDEYKGVATNQNNPNPQQNPTTGTTPTSSSSSINLSDAETSLVQDVVATTPGASTSGGSMTRGAASCLAISRLQEFRQALTNAEKIDEQFASMQATADQDRFMAALIEGDPKIFGNNPQDESLDSLTNYTSKDILEGNLNSATTSKFEDCENEPENPECEGFAGKEEDYLKIQQKVELEMTLKREVEMARVRELKKKNDSSLEDYLKENGFFDLVKNYKTMNENQLVDRIGKEFEARKVATMEEIQTRLGRRQVRAEADANEKKLVIEKTAQEAAGERARLAQVVLFNNIITSHLELSRSDGSSAGRNVNAWKKESESLEGSVDASLFSNLQDLAKETNSNGIGQNDQFGGLGFIETILGKPPENAQAP